jgi:hypothetical protein
MTTDPDRTPRADGASERPAPDEAGRAWRGYAFAVAASLATLAIRSAVTVAFGDRPLLILFVLPIILSAYVGGPGPGFTATVLTVVGVDLAFIPPLGSMEIAQGHDRVQWLMLALIGVLISALVGRLNLTKRRLQATVRRHDETRRALEFRDALLQETGAIAHVGGWEFDAATGRGAWTEEVARIHDLDPSAPSSMELGLSVYVGESRRRIEEAVRAAIDHGTPYDLELEMVSMKGARKWVRTIGHPVVENGRVTRVRGSFQNISEMKKAEARIRSLNADLDRRVDERTAELRAANRELDAFAYAVSHDLRAPLRALTGFSHALMEDHADRLPGEAKEFLRQISVAAHRMGELVDGLLKLSRATRGEVHRDPVDLSGLASRILGELAAAEPERRVETAVRPDLVARGDARMIEILLQNLLGNAWKYTARTAAARIEVGREEWRVAGGEGIGGASDARNGAGGEAPAPDTRHPTLFFVRDNGAGFDMRHAARLFAPFQRMHRQDEFPGIGIGLATVQRIVLRHGGTIEATGTPGQGATFRFTLEPTGGGSGRTA